MSSHPHQPDNQPASDDGVQPEVHSASLDSSLSNRLITSAACSNDPQFLLSLCGSIAASIAVIEVAADGSLCYSAIRPLKACWMEVSAEAAIGRAPAQIWDTDRAAIAQQRYSDCVRSRTAFSFEEYVAAGVPSWWLTTLIPLQDAQGRVCRLVETSTDITQIKQAEAAQRDRLQQLNCTLEAALRERTAQIEQAIRFEASVRRITEKIRDSLDERHILAAVTQELAQTLAIDRCKVELYDSAYLTATVVYEYAKAAPVCQGDTRRTADFPEYQQLFQRYPLQFAERVPFWNPLLTHVTRLACPIFDDQEVLGSLWLFRPETQGFEDFEIRLVQLVANECAIAIRQARLYQTAQMQVQELEKLIHIKEEFLTSISHELRTPISSISLAAQTIERVLRQSGAWDGGGTIARAIQLLQSECQREIRLVDNLLALSYANGGEILPAESIDLSEWLPEIVAPFRVRILNQQQRLEVAIAADLPALKTNRPYLERILNELLNNACKYTPAGETIALTAAQTPDGLQISVSNSGVEIASHEIACIFEKFYRTPNQDIWEAGGAGLGLTVVKKLAERLRASVEVQTTPGQTAFTVRFPRG